MQCCRASCSLRRMLLAPALVPLKAPLRMKFCNMSCCQHHFLCCKDTRQSLMLLLTLFFGSPHSDGSCSSCCCSGSHPLMLLLLLPSSAGGIHLCGCCKMLLLLLSAGGAPSSSACKLDMLRAARLLHGSASSCVALMHSILCAGRLLFCLLFVWCCCYCQNMQYTQNKPETWCSKPTVTGCWVMD
jgi:hypothetical protein